jgi:hypothetical protein
MANDPDWDTLDNYDLHYSNWLKKVDEICDRFLEVSVFEFNNMVEFHECFQVKMTPEQFIKDVFMPVLQEQGADGLELTMADQAMWGAVRPEARW